MTPSPTHADYRLVCLVSPDDVLLLLRFHPAVNGVIAHNFFQLLKIFRKLVGVDIMLGSVQARFQGNLGNRRRIVSGDDFDIYIL